jgi:hypothetical protein
VRANQAPQPGAGGQGGAATPGRGGTSPGPAPGAAGSGRFHARRAARHLADWIARRESHRRHRRRREQEQGQSPFVLYNGRSHYNEWVFVYQPQVQAPGAGGALARVPARGGSPVAGGPARSADARAAATAAAARILPGRRGGGFPAVPVNPGNPVRHPFGRGRATVIDADLDSDLRRRHL